MSENKSYWNNIYKSITNKPPIYDLWINKYKSILNKNKETTILDLGCGSGGDTLYLTERNYKVLSCDYCEEALNIVKKHIANSKTMYLDLTEKLPFKDESISVIIADLSLHYFNDATTKGIIKEIKRILKPSGYLIGRVNSINDINYGALSGTEIEKYFYLTKNGYKGFFNKEDIEYYFKDFEIKKCTEESIIRYGSEKIAWEFVVQKI